MMNYGIPYWTLFNLLLLAAWLALAVLALVQLRRLRLSDGARAVWAALIVIVPLGGALAFWIVAPGRSEEL